MSSFSPANIIIRGSEPAPIRCSVDAGLLKIYTPWYATVAVRRGLLWRTFYSGKGWASDGILPTSAEIGLVFPLDAAVRVKARGKSWLVDVHGPSQKRPRRSLRRVLRENSYFGLSAAIHLGIALILLPLVGGYGVAPHFISDEETVSERTKAESAELGLSSAPIFHPFAGVSYTQFLHRLIDRTGTLSERLDNMVGALGGEAKRVTVMTQTPDKLLAEGLSGKNLVERREGVAASVARQQFRVAGVTKESELSETTVSQKDQLELKRIFSETSGDMKRAYSKALMVDPTLAVTVAFEIEVQPSGTLKLIGCKASGKSQEAGLRSLRDGLREIFENVKVDKRLVGLRILGENAFVQ